MNNVKYILEDLDKQILESCKMQLKLHVEHLLERGVRGANIQIELDHYIKSLLKKE